MRIEFIVKNYFDKYLEKEVSFSWMQCSTKLFSSREVLSIGDKISETNFKNIAYKTVCFLENHNSSSDQLQLILRGEFKEEDKLDIKKEFEKYCRNKKIRFQYWEFSK